MLSEGGRLNGGPAPETLWKWDVSLLSWCQLAHILNDGIRNSDHSDSGISSNSVKSRSPGEGDGSRRDRCLPTSGSKNFVGNQAVDLVGAVLLMELMGRFWTGRTKVTPSDYFNRIQLYQVLSMNLALRGREVVKTPVVPAFRESHPV